jgi:hypothetical protein
MEYKDQEEEQFGHTYYAIGSSERPQYEQWIGNLTMDAFLKDVHSASSQFMEIVPFVLKLIDKRSEREFLAELELDTYTAERFFLYAVEGKPRFLQRRDHNNDGELREITADEVGDIGFEFDLATLISYNELFTCLNESMGGCAPASSLKVVMNMFCARIRLDVARITSKDIPLSIAEVALLAGMKEKSVRNVAHKEIGAISNYRNGMTLIPSEKAEQWLSARRKFVPSTALLTDTAKQALVQIQEEFFS